MLLQDEQRSKLDISDDELFYDFPRFVAHVDERFVEQLVALYRERLKPQSRLLDLMSSWISHLPDDLTCAHVEGHGLNQEELAANPRLDHYFIQNLNKSQILPFQDQSFDAVLMAVSVQYLQFPEAVFAEACRVLVPGGLMIVSFSNRMFFQKAIQAWRDGNDAMHIQLVKSYFASVPSFSPAEVVARPTKPTLMSFLGAPTADPFFAVIAQRVTT